MQTCLTFAIGVQDLKVESFDSDKELELTIVNNSRNSERTIYLSPNQVNSLISHLADQLKSIGEPVELLAAK